MSNQYFSQLSTSHKAMLLWNGGTYLCKRTLQGAKVSLYLLNNALVEVFYNRRNDNVEDIKLTSSSQSLEDYHTFFEAGLA
jgi:hypothetical protein